MYPLSGAYLQRPFRMHAAHRDPCKAASLLVFNSIFLFPLPYSPGASQAGSGGAYFYVE